MRKTILQNLAAYCIAGGILWYLSRGMSIQQLMLSVRHANLWLFIPACMTSFLVWFVGETFLFSRLFTYFHERTRFREVLAANAAQYFLQVINMMVASGALMLFLHQRKRVPWLAAGCTLLFQTFIDWFILASMTIIAALAVPSSQIWFGLPIAGVALVVWFLIAAFWYIGNPRLRIGKWFYNRPSMVSFRQATPQDYLRLMAIRAPIFAAQGFVLYFELRAFHITVPIHQVLAFTPAVLVMGGLPITPVGMGPLQAVLIAGFASFATKPLLLSMSLAISMMNLAMRIPLGLGSAGAFAHEVSEREKKQPVGEVEVATELVKDTFEEIAEKKRAGATG